MEKKMTHAIERKAFEVAIDAAIKHTNKDRSKALLQLVDLMEKTLGDGWSPQAYEALREIFRHFPPRICSGLLTGKHQVRHGRVQECTCGKFLNK